MSKFIPLQHRPQLPHDTSRTDSYHEFSQVAWAVYWGWVEKVVKRQHCSITAARKTVHHRGVTPRRVENKPGRFWDHTDYLVAFMLQFEKWQQESYDLDALNEEDNHRGCFSDHYPSRIPAKTVTLDEFFAVLNYGERENLMSFLAVSERWDLIRSLTDDPIYGAEAEFELRQRAWRKDFERSEKRRRAALPENIKRIDRTIRPAGPSNYTVIYPYPPNQYHNVPNCLCVMADGGPIFRLEVLDPETCTRFRLAELMSPWWSLYGGIGESPAAGEGEYDFPFPDFDIQIDDEFGLNKLMEVLRAGVEQIATRGTRKFGV